MLPELKSVTHLNNSITNIYLISKISDLPENIFDKDEIEYISTRLSEKNQQTVILNKLGRIAVVYKPDATPETSVGQLLEKCRKTGESILGMLGEHKIK